MVEWKAGSENREHKQPTGLSGWPAESVSTRNEKRRHEEKPTLTTFLSYLEAASCLTFEMLKNLPWFDSLGMRPVVGKTMK